MKTEKKTTEQQVKIAQLTEKHQIQYAYKPYRTLHNY